MLEGANLRACLADFPSTCIWAMINQLRGVCTPPEMAPPNWLLWESNHLRLVWKKQKVLTLNKGNHCSINQSWKVFWLQKRAEKPWQRHFYRNKKRPSADWPSWEDVFFLVFVTFCSSEFAYRGQVSGSGALAQIWDFHLEIHRVEETEGQRSHIHFQLYSVHHRKQDTIECGTLMIHLLCYHTSRMQEKNLI